MAVLIRRVLLVVNPLARHVAARERLVLAELQSAGVRCEMARTAHAGHAAELTREQTADDRVDAVFTLGGDGTAMEVAGALSGRGIPVGILPAGTANQLARYLRTPLDVRRALRALLCGQSVRIDLARLADGRRFALTAGFGMDVAMIAQASRRAKRTFGVAAYFWTGARALVRNARFQMRASVDGVLYERECAVAMIVNVGSFFGGRMRAGPGVRPNDGTLDLCVYSARTVFEGAALVRRCFAGDFRPHRNTLFVRGESIRLESVPASVAEADGEFLAPGALDAVVEPLAAHLLCCDGVRVD